MNIISFIIGIIAGILGLMGIAMVYARTKAKRGPKRYRVSLKEHIQTKER